MLVHYDDILRQSGATSKRSAKSQLGKDKSEEDLAGSAIHREQMIFRSYRNSEKDKEEGAKFLSHDMSNQSQLLPAQSSNSLNDKKGGSSSEAAIPNIPNPSI